MYTYILKPSLLPLVLLLHFASSKYFPGLSVYKGLCSSQKPFPTAPLTATHYQQTLSCLLLLKTRSDTEFLFQMPSADNPTILNPDQMLRFFCPVIYASDELPAPTPSHMAQLFYFFVFILLLSLSRSPGPLCRIFQSSPTIVPSKSYQ